MCGPVTVVLPAGCLTLCPGFWGFFFVVVGVGVGLGFLVFVAVGVGVGVAAAVRVDVAVGVAEPDGEALAVAVPVPSGKRSTTRAWRPRRTGRRWRGPHWVRGDRHHPAAVPRWRAASSCGVRPPAARAARSRAGGLSCDAAAVPAAQLAGLAAAQPPCDDEEDQHQDDESEGGAEVRT